MIVLPMLCLLLCDVPVERIKRPFLIDMFAHVFVCFLAQIVGGQKLPVQETCPVKSVCLLLQFLICGRLRCRDTITINTVFFKKIFASFVITHGLKRTPDFFLLTVYIQKIYRPAAFIRSHRPVFMYTVACSHPFMQGLNNLTISLRIRFLKKQYPKT